MNKKEELLEKKANLEKELADVNNDIGKEDMKAGILKMRDFTDTLNSMFQDSFLEEHCPDECNELYEVMQKIDRKHTKLMDDHGFEEGDLYE
jgi:hypothetical protein